MEPKEKELKIRGIKIGFNVDTWLLQQQVKNDVCPVCGMVLCEHRLTSKSLPSDFYK